MSVTEKDYFVPFSDYAEDSFVEKRSKFTGRLWRVETAEEAVAKIKEMRETYWDATHNCYAYILREGNIMRYSDDGEPQGTAGMPMLEVLRHEGLVNVCCVVTRYFGGILLGTGGLVRAYTKGVQIAVAAAGVQQMSRFATLLIACPYNLLGTVQQVLPAHDCTVEDTDYGADVTLTVVQPVGGLDALNRALADATAGTVYAEPMDERFMGRRIK
ncbi:MAG: YigZ family protein [Butyricicoccus sp.]|nr:YigZ family protein [Clostridiales bacterium]MDY5972962.1 YigZ family protein [Butyricicoccus sp.]